MLSLKRREKTTSSSDDNKIDHRYVVYIFFFGSTLFLIQFRYFVWQNQLITCPCADASWSFFPCIFTETQKKTFFSHLIALNLLMVQLLAENFYLNEWIWMSHACVRVNKRANEKANAWHASAMHELSYFE